MDLTLLAPVPFEPFKPRQRTPGPRKERWHDEWRVGLLSPDPSNPRPVFSPPTKPRDERTKENDSGEPPAPTSEEKAVECASVVEEQEQVDDGDTDTELAEEEEVFGMTSINDIRVTLPEDEAQDQYVHHPPTRDFRQLTFLRQRQRR